MAKIVVIGGANIDFIGKSNDELISGDSNIGKVTMSFGGVSRNIVEGLGRLDTEVVFISAIGNDTLGIKLKEELTSLGVKVITPIGEYKTGMYLAIHDDKGKMNLALCDQDSVDYITTDFITSLDNIISESEYLLIDTNLNKATLDYLLNKYQDKTIFLDVISINKGRKIVDNVDKITYLKCNEIEAETLFGKNYFDSFSKNTLIVTRGSKDILYNVGKGIKCSKVIKASSIVNETGAGDSLFFGFIYGIINGYDIDSALEIGKKCAKLSLESECAVSKESNKEAIKK